MPTNNPTNPLEWNAENMEQVGSDLYREIESDESLRQRLLTDPFEVLSSRIAIPESYRDGILLTPKGQDTMVLYVPPANAGRTDAAVEGTSEETPQKSYQMLCTVIPQWYKPSSFAAGARASIIKASCFRNASMFCTGSVISRPRSCPAVCST